MENQDQQTANASLSTGSKTCCSQQAERNDHCKGCHDLNCTCCFGKLWGNPRDKKIVVLGAAAAVGFFFGLAT